MLSEDPQRNEIHDDYLCMHSDTVPVPGQVSSAFALCNKNLGKKCDVNNFTLLKCGVEWMRIESRK